MISSSSFIQANRYKKILSLAAKPNFYLIGLGKVSPWSLDISPPTGSGVETTVQELIGYIRVTEISGVVRATTSTDFNLAGIGYKKLPNTLTSLQSNNCQEICFAGVLTHNQLTQLSWRSLSLFESASAITASGLITSTLSNLTLVYLAHFPPKTKEENALERIRLVLPVSEAI